MATAPRNPNWTRDELILALDLYLRHRQRLPDQTHPDVVELSEALRRLNRQLSDGSGTFRNANGVGMKLGNLRALDPLHTDHGKRGLQRGGKGDVEVWNAYADQPERLREVVAALRAAVEVQDAAPPEAGVDAEGVEAPEGRLLTRLHNYRERNRTLVRKRKEHALRVAGQLQCEVCGLVPTDTYGEPGAASIEVHHTLPLHTLRAGTVTRLNDLALVCANCHRVIHSRAPWFTVEELRALHRALGAAGTQALRGEAV
ncbi:MAG: endonuclease [Microvirga sp.]|jgi:5-methylcytosine-specific restriction protein A|nr:endonuclease [Microvirga sp.]